MKIEESGILDGVDLDAYAGNVRAAALREAARLAPSANTALDEAEFVTYGHIVVDEARTSRQWSCACSSVATSRGR